MGKSDSGKWSFSNKTINYTDWLAIKVAPGKWNVSLQSCLRKGQAGIQVLFFQALYEITVIVDPNVV